MQQVLLPPSAPAGDSEAYIPPVPIAAAIGTQVELPPPTIPVPSPVAAATGNQVELPPPTIPVPPLVAAVTGNRESGRIIGAYRADCKLACADFLYVKVILHKLFDFLKLVFV